MPYLHTLATAVPEHVVDQGAAKVLCRRHYAGHLPDLDRLLPLFDGTGIRRRHLCRPPEWYLEPRSFEENNRTFIEEATRLGAEAAESALSSAGLSPKDVDYLLLVNTTGLATPSIDARLMNVLGLPAHTRRTPIWGLGCAGGAAGLAHAHHYALGHPRARVLLVAVELCSLTFLSDDYSKSNLVACALFSDGAAAALVTGDEVAWSGYELLATRSTFYPDSLEIMGWNVRSRGLQVVFNRRIPDIVRNNAHQELTDFLAAHDLELEDVQWFLYHPGGRKVLDAYREAYGTGEEPLRFSREILAEYGNMSSVTVLSVLERCLEEDALQTGAHAVASALGPGFCSETVLLRNG